MLFVFIVMFLCTARVQAASFHLAGNPDAYGKSPPHIRAAGQIAPAPSVRLEQPLVALHIGPRIPVGKQTEREQRHRRHDQRRQLPAHVG